ncbi:putative signal peptide and transmembrane protein [Rhodopirellula islandica]|uniref:Signal peptide and transmembrane protein n=1 Tax=Rhodopirellula islandica TaxID=595434 RepID=A0A0J1B4S5_RHOIS|nr:hypothetical protein [Rhodopirellula islandica]KLU01618.1 putative signal peptide and transmembrane protein [Rhodopirellula islandica]
MTSYQPFLIWLLFALISIPLAGVAWSTRKQSRELMATTDFTPKTTYEGPLVEDDDGTRSQTLTVSTVTSVSAWQVVRLGPFAIVVHAREWAANAVLLAIVLMGIGLAGLLHFPTQSP